MWLVEIKARAKAAGVPFLGDLGNEEHLQSSNPLDHTPFSNTEYPIPLTDYWINAIDLGDGPWSDRLLAECRAGRARWVKYLLFRGKSYSRRNNWQQTSGPDQHLHISGMTDHLHDSIGDFNPFIAAAPPRPSTVEDEVLLLAQVANGDGTVWLGNGLQRRAITREATVRNLIARGADATYTAAYWGGKGGLPTLADLEDMLGPAR